jgi:NAD(P)-dependent dehydrogenase (short-subunit alcohol dehydrogenase family)
MELSGKTAVITGGASGIGLATGRQFAACGMNLVLGDIEEEPLRDAVEGLRAEGAKVIGLSCDVSSEADVVKLRDGALGEFGAAHVVFNNAGVVGGPSIGTPKKVWDWVMGVNVDGVINGINAFVPLFLEQNEGHVVNTASLAGLGGQAGTGAYCASKFAVVGISESLFHELTILDKNVGVSVLCPGYVRTRIKDSERTMPHELQGYNPHELQGYNDDPAVKAIQEISRSLVDSGIEASDVAALVQEGVRENRFWILPHEYFAQRITERRLEWMRGGEPIRSMPKMPSNS